MNAIRPASAPLPPGAVLPPMAPPETHSQPVEALLAASELGRIHRTQRQPKGVNQAPRSSKPTGDNPALHPSRFATINAFVDITMRGLSSRAALVWLVLWRDTKQDGLARTGVTDIARRLNCSRATVKRALAELRRRHLVEVVKRGRLGEGPSSYRVLGTPAKRAPTMGSDLQRA
jgi:hypothetical protein